MRGKSILFSRLGWSAVFMLLQIAAIFVVLVWFNDRFVAFYGLCVVLSLFVVVMIINGKENSAYKIAWIIPVLTLPLFGTMLYFMFRGTRLKKQQKALIKRVARKSNQGLPEFASCLPLLKNENREAARQAAYLENAAYMPAYKHTETEYFHLGDVMYLKMLEELRKAEKFIFMEYFIIEPGIMWESILEILEEKAKKGVDVRLIYDDLGCVFTLPDDYPQQLTRKGIRCCIYHRFKPALSGSFNNRDHRKICVVDGIVAFTGGINLADEYINSYAKYGHWLDCGIMLRGEAVWSFSLMFLIMWDYICHDTDNYVAFAPDAARLSDIAEDGFVQPFADSPADDEPIGEMVYINMLNMADDYVYICTPYLIIDNEMITAMTMAAKRGVDVRIITPGIPDKKTIFLVTRSYYADLIAAGVRIFEYTPGFIHSKTFVCDDLFAVCGTINLDYRSLYLHHECAAWLYKSRAVLQMKKAYLDILPQCTEIPENWCAARPLSERILQVILRVFAPLM